MLLLGGPSSAVAWIPLKCPLKFWTGLDCPTCGLGRAVFFLLDGQWQLSWDYHPLAILLSAAWLLWVLQSFSRARSNP